MALALSPGTPPPQPRGRQQMPGVRPPPRLLAVVALLLLSFFTHHAAVSADEDATGSASPCSAHGDCTAESYCTKTDGCARCIDDGEDICSVYQDSIDGSCARCKPGSAGAGAAGVSTPGPAAPPMTVADGEAFAVLGTRFQPFIVCFLAVFLQFLPVQCGERPAGAFTTEECAAIIA